MSQDQGNDLRLDGPEATTTATNTSPKEDTTINSEVDEYYHYQLVCNYCGRTWWGLHCPHDGYQNPCPMCHLPPIPIKGDCSCVLVAPISTIAQEANKAELKGRIDELEQVHQCGHNTQAVLFRLDILRNQLWP